MTNTITANVEAEIAIYSVECECGEELNFRLHIDRQDDLIVTVDEHICIQEEEEE